MRRLCTVLACLCVACCTFKRECQGLTFEEPELRASIHVMEQCDVGDGSMHSCYQQSSQKQGEVDEVSASASVQESAQNYDAETAVHNELANIFVGLMPSVFDFGLADPYLLHDRTKLGDGLKLCFPRIRGRVNVVKGRVHFVRDAVMVTTASAAKAAFNFSVRVNSERAGYFVGRLHVAFSRLAHPGRLYQDDNCIVLRPVDTFESGQMGISGLAHTTNCMGSEVAKMIVDIGLVAYELSGQEHHVLIGKQRLDNVKCRNDMSIDPTMESDNTVTASQNDLQIGTLPKLQLFYCQYEMAMYATLSPMTPGALNAARKYFRAGCILVSNAGSSSTDDWVCLNGKGFENLFSENEIDPASKGLQITSGPFFGPNATMTLLFVPRKPGIRVAEFTLSLRHTFTRYHYQIALWGAVGRGTSPKELQVIARGLELHGGCADNTGAGNSSENVNDFHDSARVLHSSSFMPFISELSTPLIIAVQRGDIDAVHEL